MRTALLADIHGNREALSACLADAKRIGVDRYVFLGDLVGYGPDPVWVVEQVATMVSDGALAVLGNHDAVAITCPKCSRFASCAHRDSRVKRLALRWGNARAGK